MNHPDRIRTRRPPVRVLMGVRCRLRAEQERELQARASLSGRTVEREWALLMRSYLAN